MSAEWNRTEETVVYSYGLTSLSDSELDLTGFDVLTEFAPLAFTGHWEGNHLTTQALRRSKLRARLSWGAASRSEMLQPGRTLDEKFEMVVDALPGISEYHASGWVELMVVEEVPPQRRPQGVMPVDKMFRIEKTIGPIYPLPAAKARPAGLATFLVEQSRKAESLGWLQPHLHLPAQLQRLERSLATGHASLAGLQIRDLQRLLREQRNQAVSSEGYALLSPSLAFLASKFPSRQPFEKPHKNTL